jgi:hypothetical protein
MYEIQRRSVCVCKRLQTCAERLWSHFSRLKQVVHQVLSVSDYLGRDHRGGRLLNTLQLLPNLANSVCPFIRSSSSISNK